MTPEELSDRLMDNTQSPYHFGNLATATHRGIASNPTCGDWVEVELKVSGEGVIEEAWFRTQGCMLCRGATSILIQHIEKEPICKATSLSVIDILELIEVPIAPLRQRCATLALYALRNSKMLKVPE